MRLPTAWPPLAFALAALVAPVAAGTLLSACEDPARECSNDVDCGAGLVCTADFRCAACESNADCGDDAFCCRGACHGAADVDALCGCGPSLAANGGTDCGTVNAPAGGASLCLVGDVAATPDTVAQGTCGCGCSPAEGGPLCGPPDAAGAAPTCSCADNADCRGPSVDATGRPHLATDTCAPNDACICFNADDELACDPDGAAPDCTSGGCRSLDADVDNCGVPGRVCSDPASGLADGSGACIAGGCRCDAATDCVDANGGALNVDQCVFFGNEARCVCAGYEANGAQAACPLEATCGDDGCVVEGTAYATQDALLAALGVAAP